MQHNVHSNDILWIIEQIQRLEVQVAKLVETCQPHQGFEQEWFTPSEFGKQIGKSAYTIRQWIRLGKLKARRRGVGRGGKAELEISKTELCRYLNHGVHQVQDHVA